MMYRIGPTDFNLQVERRLSTLENNEDLTEAREAVRKAVEETDLRTVADAITATAGKVSHTTVRNLMNPDHPVSPKTVQLVRRWMEVRTEAPAAEYRAGYVAGLRRAEEALRQVIAAEVKLRADAKPTPRAPRTGKKDERRDAG